MTRFSDIIRRGYPSADFYMLAARAGDQLKKGDHRLDLRQYGYNDRVSRGIGAMGAGDGLTAGRITDDFGTGFSAATDAGEIEAVLSGAILSDKRELRPVAGDWALIRLAPEKTRGQIVRVMPRMSELRRADSHVTWKSVVVAANFDYLMMMVSMNANYSLNRIERLIAAAWSSGGTPVLVLSKKDACDDADLLEQRAMDAVPGTDVVSISALTGEGVDVIEGYFKPGVTCAVVGSSGVGKSTLLNRLMGYEAAKTAEIRQGDSKGRHTTTSRALRLLPTGGMLIDTPGIRAFGLTAEDDDLSGSFQDIEELAIGCRFDDCSHTGEPGCAVLQAIEDGFLESRRYDSYMKMVKEVMYVKSKGETAAWLERKRKGKLIAKIQRSL